ncbi:hypothetical protein M2352_001586 [Azospirillum fermentarium]|mgnify:CR=1 FL=1|uniref:hypothetical protein n=1 Tax=Azospirillum fermentarium TaxID=1233114 RepID=UPI002226F721|nr:hypothetical protein [Azospirillum fermentarium]MCW2245995.1 hypothetical protein [Azospirillum fermentarium]
MTPEKEAELFATLNQIAASLQTLPVILARLDGLEKRLDDQARMIAALIPTRIAAVPPPAA